MDSSGGAQETHDMHGSDLMAQRKAYYRSNRGMGFLGYTVGFAA